MVAKRILVVATAEDCPACVGFKRNTWPGLRDALVPMLENGELELKEIVQKRRVDPVDTSRYPKDLQRFIAWYPIVMLFSADSWARTRRNPDEKLDGRVYGGTFDATGKPNWDQSTEISRDKILAWIKENPEPTRTPVVSNSTHDYSRIQRPNDIGVVPAAACRRRYQFEERSS